jgi:hypothetical protein
MAKKKTSTPMVSGSPSEEAGEAPGTDTPAEESAEVGKPPVKVTKKSMNRRLQKAIPTNQALKPNSNKVTTFKKPGFQAGGLLQQIQGGHPPSPQHVINVNVHPAVSRRLQTRNK